LPRPEPLDKQIARGEYGAVTGGARQPGTLADLITKSENHYHVTKNPVSDPIVEPEGWRLILDGELQSPVQVDYRTLRQLPSLEVARTLECISNYTSSCELVPHGCELIGTALWKGVPLQDLFRLAGGLKPNVVSVSLLGVDEFNSTIPIDVALDPGTILAYEMNGTVLPYEHGYPARVLATGRYGYKSAKWVGGIRVNARDVPDWYAQRNWDREGIVETMTRIDLPATAAALPPGRHRVAGIAYAGDRGVSGVEYSLDGGASWQPATLLEPAPARDTWVRWEGSFELRPGQTLRLLARATDGVGQLQTETFALPAPGGATGWPSIQLRGQ
jgi:DMSO/TMAO reductase YedYZ molybdopterin-dependent catalytic subunit